MNKNHYFNTVDKVEGIDLASEEIIIFSKKYSMFHHENIIKNFEKDGFKPNIVHTADSISELILMVFLNKGVAVLPKESLSKTDLDNISFVTIKNTNHKYKYSVAVNKKYMTSEIIDFVDCLISEFQNHNNS